MPRLLAVALLAAACVSAGRAQVLSLLEASVSACNDADDRCAACIAIAHLPSPCVPIHAHRLLYASPALH